MADWSDKKRLEVINNLIHKFKLRNLTQEQIDDLEKIEFLTIASDEFLEANKSNFSDVLETRD